MKYSYSRAYLVNYNKFLTFDTDKLLQIALVSNNHFLETIALRVLIVDNRLLTIDNYQILSLIIRKLAIEDMWELSKLECNSMIVEMAKEKIYAIIDESFSQKEKVFRLTK